jgi:predicted MFS family arabinose efflux permease
VSSPAHPHQFKLLSEARFRPFFWSAFLGTFNDNLLKFAITIWLTYNAPQEWLPAAQVGPMLGALFTVPTLLFSALFGQMADKWPLDALFRWGKVFEIGMMVLAAGVFLSGHAPLMLVCVWLSGLQVTWYSTLKYAYLPRHLQARELVGGNGLMEMGMFTAILLGTLMGGALVEPQAWSAAPHADPAAQVAAVIVLVSLWGWRLSLLVPETPAVVPALKLRWNPVLESWRDVQFSRHGAKDSAWQGRSVLVSILGISWMWFFGALFMMLLPAMVRDVLQAQSSVASACMALVSIGIGLGALCCERLSQGKLARHTVSLGALGMALFGGDIAWCAWALEGHAQAPVGGWALLDYLRQPLAWRLGLDVWFMSMAIGLFSVPLYADMQARSDGQHRARIVGANNIVNAVAMVLSAALAGMLSAAGLGLGQVMGVVVALHVLICGCMRKAWQVVPV